LIQLFSYRTASKSGLRAKFAKLMVRFRMNKELFIKMMFGPGEYDDYFLMKKDCTGM
jgi:hypothetical protein